MTFDQGSTPTRPAPGQSSESPEGGAAERSRARNRRWLVRGGVAILVLAAMSAAALFMGTRFLDPVQLAGWLEPKIEEALGRDVNVSSARVDLFPPVAVALEGLEVANPGGFADGTFAKLAELRLDLELMQLLRRNVSIDEIRLGSPEIDVVVGEDGTSNAEGLGGPSGPSDRDSSVGQGGAPFQVGIESIRIDQGSLTYRDLGVGTAVAIAPLRARFRVRTGPEGQWLVSGDTRARVGARTAGSDPTRVGPFDVRVETSGVASNDLKTLRLSDSAIEIEELLLTLAAEVMRTDEGTGAVDLQVAGQDLEIENVLSLLPDSLTDQLGALAGLMSVDVGYAAQYGSGSDNGAELLGQVALSDVSVTGNGGAPLVSSLSGGLNLSLDSLWTTNLEGVALGGSARIRGLVRLGNQGGFAVRVAAKPDLSQLSSVFTLPDSVTVAGGLSLDITARGTLDDPAAATLTGRAVPDAVAATLPGIGVPLGLPEGTILLDGDVIRWRDLPVLLGEDRFNSSGELRDIQAWARDGDGVPALGGSFTGERFDYDAVFPGPPPDSMVLYGRLMFARLGERSVAGRAPKEILTERGLIRPDSLPFAGDVSVAFATLLSAPYELSDVRAQVEFRPTLIQITNMEAGAYGGRVAADIDVGLGPETDQPFSLALTVEGVRAGDFLAATSPLGQVFDGTLSLNLDVSGDLDDVYLPTRASVLGSGAFSLQDATIHAGAITDAISGFFSVPELRDLSLTDWTAPLLLKDGRVVLRESTVKGAFGEPRLAGTMGFGGQVALDLLFQLPTERVDSATLARLGLGHDVFRRVQTSGRPLEAALRVAGTVVEPLLSADQGGVTQGIAEAVEEEAEAQVEEEIEERKQALEERATEAVERILGPEVPAGDSTATQPPGLNDLRRLLTPDLLRPRRTPDPDPPPATDTAPRPDSIRPDTTRSS